MPPATLRASPPHKEKDLTQRAQRKESTEFTEKSPSRKARSFNGFSLRAIPMRGVRRQLDKTGQGVATLWPRLLLLTLAARYI